MKLFPWRTGPERANPSLRDSGGVSPRDDDSTDAFLDREPFLAGCRPFVQVRRLRWAG